jgi:hypothetical protein
MIDKPGSPPYDAYGVHSGRWDIIFRMIFTSDFGDRFSRFHPGKR